MYWPREFTRNSFASTDNFIVIDLILSAECYASNSRRINAIKNRVLVHQKMKVVYLWCCDREPFLWVRNSLDLVGQDCADTRLSEVAIPWMGPLRPTVIKPRITRRLETILNWYIVWIFIPGSWPMRPRKWQTPSYCCLWLVGSGQHFFELRWSLFIVIDWWRAISLREQISVT